MEKLSELLSEESKGSRMQIPLSVLEKITEYQLAYREHYGKKISRENVLLLAVVYGLSKIEGDTQNLTYMTEQKKETA